MASVVSWSVTGLLLVMIACVIVYAVVRGRKEPPVAGRKITDVEVVTIRPEVYRETLYLPARVEADAVGAVSPEFPGKLKRWHVSEGDFVRQGQAVAEMETDLLENSLAELRASREAAVQNAAAAGIIVESERIGYDVAVKQIRIQELILDAAESDRELAEKDFRRIEALAAMQAVDRSRLDTARNRLTQARLGVERAAESLKSARLSVRNAEKKVAGAEARLTLAKTQVARLDASIGGVLLRIEKSTMRSPISGRLDEHLVEPGEFVAAGQVVARIYDLEHVRATVNVADRYVAFLDAGDPAAGAVVRKIIPGAVHRVDARLVISGLPGLTSGDRTSLSFSAEIVRIAQAADPASNTFEVEMRLANPGGILRHGLIGRGVIQYLEYPDAVVIPLKSAQVTDEGPRVVVVEREDGRDVARIRDIEPVSVRDDRLLVGKGLRPGDRLIVAGWKGLVEGEVVNILVEDGRIRPRT